jgi:anti-sigma B factor antagonist
MQLETKKVGDVLVVSVLEKRLDASIKDDFRKHMLDFVSSGHQRIVLDMSDVEFVDSSGLGVIVGVHEALGGTGNLAICNLAESTLRMFKLAGMHRVFNIVEGEWKP